MDKQVELFICSCHPCQLVCPRPKPEPIKSTKMPDRPWSELAVDLLEIPGGNHLLVLIYYHSHWPEVTFMNKTDASKVIGVFEHMFQTYGLSDSLRSDNGPLFQSREFAGFLEYLGIEHKRGIPLSPESNEEVKRFNRTLLKTVRISQAKNGDHPWKIFYFSTTQHLMESHLKPQQSSSWVEI